MIVRARSVWLPSASISTCRFCADTKKPGAIALTRMPSPYRRASSTASQRVKLSMPAFATEYPSTPLSARGAAIDEMLTIEPDPAAMASPNASDGRRVPCRLSRTTSSKRPGGTSKMLRSSFRAGHVAAGGVDQDVHARPERRAPGRARGDLAPHRARRRPRPSPRGPRPGNASARACAPRDAGPSRPPWHPPPPGPRPACRRALRSPR